MGTSSDPGATVLIVDDHPLVRHGLSALLAHESWVGRVYEASTAGEALELAVTHRPGVAVVDLRLPDYDGVELVRRLRRSAPECLVLVLTMTRDESAVRSCLDAGASGYVLKETAPQAVVHAIRTVSDGGLVLGPQVRARAAAPRPAADLPPPLDRLAPRDVRLLTLLAEGQRNGQIAHALGISEKTVRNRLSGILVLLGVADRVQAALLARDKGLLGPPTT
jgi:DNA-binding NarL/FixJ family response regulator